MKKSIFLFSFLLASCTAFCQAPLTGKNITGRELLYSFTGGSRLITIHSDSALSWKDGNSSKTGTEKTVTVHVDEHTLITSWYNEEKTFVTMYSDLEKMKFVFMVCWPDGKYYPVEGVIRLKD